ncbi:MAG: DUF3157 family protein [Betaproteobacteria bacterium]|nr:MAG: DUF3157 family protein [Betaproteobacteria bacterium]
MKRYSSLILCALGAAAIGVSPAYADFEVTAPDGRRILLKDDKTWRYVEAESDQAAKKTDAAAASKDAKAASDDKEAKAGDKPKDTGEAVLHLAGKIPGNRICRFQLKLVNNLPYEIRSLVPEFAIYRPNGVVYDSQFSGFSFIKPGDSQMREVRFNGIACEDIARVQVGGGDRCEMGELDKFSPVKGECLARVRVVASDIVRFDK